MRIVVLVFVFMLLSSCVSESIINIQEKPEYNIIFAESFYIEPNECKPFQLTEENDYTLNVASKEGLILELNS